MKQYRQILLVSIIMLAIIFLPNQNAAAMNLISEGNFDSGSTGDWWAAGANLYIANGQLCAATIGNGGANSWNALIGHDGLNLQAGSEYDFRVDINAPAGRTIDVAVQLSADPWTPYDAFTVVGRGWTESFDRSFQQPVNDSAAAMVFSFGGQGAMTLCIDNISLEAPFTPPPTDDNAIRVNQMGYFVDGGKHATLVQPGNAPQTWTLRNASGTTVHTGTTQPFGTDLSSNLNVHHIDFSSYVNGGTGFTLQVGTEVSYPFDIGANPYGDILYDSLHYFYYHRSSALTTPYVGDPQWVRPAGASDNNVACWPGSGCAYRRDVSGGWYDAADYGKYTVNSATSVWTLLNLYERGLYANSSVLTQFRDGSMNIPESWNGVSDLLDEARYNLEFMLGMQVPANQPLAGMVHHKMHNREWHNVGTYPHEIDGTDRFLTPPTTIATLNFAAIMAQCARVWENVDVAFAAQCLNSAENAWQAAVANPNRTHPDEPYNNGGGPYSNTAAGAEITDEWYWAAAELFITTGETQYENVLLASPHHGSPAQVHISSFVIDMQGRISLSTVPNALAASELVAVRNSIVDLADWYVILINDTGFGVPVTGDNYYWGSNGEILNRGMILGTAYDATGNPVYLEAMQQIMNYIFGRNPLGISYVTGYGEYATETPTSTWCANAADPSMPPIPPGYLTGGPNRLPVDPPALAALSGCVGATCYLDDIHSYSTNEPAINLNASLVWMTSFLLAEAAPDIPTNVQARVFIPIVQNNALPVIAAAIPLGVTMWVFGRNYFTK